MVKKDAFVIGGIGAAFAILSTNVLGTYGWGLFVLLPFCLGLLSSSPSIAVAGCVIAALLPLAVGVEGLICIAMAIPLALPLAMVGALVVSVVRRYDRDPRRMRSFGAVAVLLPLAMGLEAGADRKPPLRSVTTSIVVDAPPSVVWRHVLAFGPLERPRELAFRAGIAYPTSATIEGQGVGAIRRCRFSTGDFVEPITVWDPPRLLRFDVAHQPPPMRELTPFKRVRAPHLDGFLRSREGQFRLRPLPGGKTLLQGTTRYENRMWPARYWALWSDELIASIHRRVLEHIAATARRDAPRRAVAPVESNMAGYP